LEGALLAALNWGVKAPVNGPSENEVPSRTNHVLTKIKAYVKHVDKKEIEWLRKAYSGRLEYLQVETCRTTVFKLGNAIEQSEAFEGYRTEARGYAV
jgi:hypothetical protein